MADCRGTMFARLARASVRRGGASRVCRIRFAKLDALPHHKSFALCGSRRCIRARRGRELPALSECECGCGFLAVPGARKNGKAKTQATGSGRPVFLDRIIFLTI